MARNPSLRLSEAVINRQREEWGEDSKEFRVLDLLNKTRVAYGILAELLPDANADSLRRLFTGERKYSTEMDNYYRDMSIYLLDYGYKNGLLPCSDLAVVPGIMRFIHGVTTNNPAIANQSTGMLEQKIAELEAENEQLRREIDLYVDQAAHEMENNPSAKDKIETHEKLIDAIERLKKEQERASQLEQNIRDWQAWYEQVKPMLNL